MKYQLSRDGSKFGEFSLDELRDGRAAGHFSGQEFVWRESASEWQAIDEFLKSELARPRTTPPPILRPSGPKRNRHLLWSVSIIGVLLAVGVAVLSIVAVKVVPRFRQVSGTGRPSDTLTAAKKPVVAGTNAITQSGLRERRREFRARQWIEGYQQNANHASACDAESREYLEAWLDTNYGAGHRTNRPTVREWGDRLAANSECADPLVLTLTGVESDEPHESVRRLERALEAFPRSRHKAYVHFYAAVSLVDELDPPSDRVAALDELAVTQLRLCFTDGSFQPGDAAEIADILINGWGENFFRRNSLAVTTMVAADKTPAWEWLSLVLAGEHHIRRAWDARGGGYADKVTDRGWRKFSSELVEARRCLTRAWTLHSDLPLAPARMIYVALGSSDITEMRLWFDRAVAAQFDYPRAWEDMRWGLLPRWHGGLDSMSAFGITALNTGRFDTDVPRMLFDSIADLESEMELSPRNRLFGATDLWPHLQRMYEGYIAAPTQQASRKGWRTVYTIVAHLAGKDEISRAQLEALEWQPQTNKFDSWRTDLSLLPLEVAALTGPLAAAIRGAEAKRLDLDCAGALAAYQQLAADARADERTRQLLRHRVATLDLETQLQGGDWVNFLPLEDNDPAWNVRAGNYVLRPDHAVEVSAGKLGHMIVCRARVGPDFELRGEVEFVRSSTPDAQAGLVFGMPDPSNSDWYSFRLKRNATEGELASYARGWSSRQVRADLPVNPQTNLFSFTFHSGLVNASVNGDSIYRDTKPPGVVRYAGEEFLVGLGAFNDLNDTVIRYRNVQLRVLPSQKSPAHR